MKLSDRLIVAVDYDPRVEGGSKGVLNKLGKLIDDLAGTNVILKFNALLRCFGYQLIATLRERGIQVMADLKLMDIPHTLMLDGAFLAEFCPVLVTVMTQSTVDGMKHLQVGLGQREQENLAMIAESACATETLGVTVLTSQGGAECEKLFGRKEVVDAVRVFALMAHTAGCGGLILSGKEVPVITELQLEPPLSLNTPGIRPEWSVVTGDDQAMSRITTPTAAIKGGATRIVCGRPITGAGPNDKGMPQSPREAVEKILAEIETALASRSC